ncbi:unnamed protein product, partial [Ectocarpus sp. 12 AP-2014]
MHGLARDLERAGFLCTKEDTASTKKKIVPKARFRATQHTSTANSYITGWGTARARSAKYSPTLATTRHTRRCHSQTARTATSESERGRFHKQSGNKSLSGDTKIPKLASLLSLAKLCPWHA